METKAMSQCGTKAFISWKYHIVSHVHYSLLPKGENGKQHSSKRIRSAGVRVCFPFTSNVIWGTPTLSWIRCIFGLPSNSHKWRFSAGGKHYQFHRRQGSKVQKRWLLLVFRAVPRWIDNIYYIYICTHLCIAYNHVHVWSWMFHEKTKTGLFH